MRDNPYPEGSAENIAWDNGWRKGHDDSESHSDLRWARNTAVDAAVVVFRGTAQDRSGRLTELADEIVVMAERFVKYAETGE